MRWQTITQILLFAVVISQQSYIVITQKHEPSLAGMPLSEAEYEEFFQMINSPSRMGMICFLRSSYGCHHSLVEKLDRYENHGIIPKGQVCSNMAEHPTFPDFCTLALYRCTLKKYFVKRVLCPSEISTTSTDTEIIDQQMEPDQSTSSPLQALAEILDDASTAATTAISTSTKSFLYWLADIFSTTTTLYQQQSPVSNVLAASTTIAVSASELPTERVTEKRSLLSLLIESTGQPFTPSATTTMPMQSPEASSAVLVSEIVSHELHATPAPPPELHPAVLVSATVTPSPEASPAMLVSEIVNHELHATPMPPPEHQPATLVSATVNLEHHTASTSVASTTESVPKLPVTTSALATTTEPVLDLLLEPTVELLAPTAARTETESVLKHFTVSEALTAAETSQVTNAATSTASVSQPPTNSTTAKSQNLLLEFFSSMASAITRSHPQLTDTTAAPPTTESSSEMITSSSTTTTTTSSSSSTTTTGTSSTPMHSATSIGKKITREVRKSATTATTTKSSPLPTHSVIATPSSTAKTRANHLPVTSSVSSLSTKATTHENTVIVSSTATSSQTNSIAVPSPPQKQSPQADSNIGIFLFSTFFHRKIEQIPGLIPLLEMRPGSPDAQQWKEFPQFPTSNLKDIFFQMQDSTVQQLTQHMHNLMAKDKMTNKQQLQATSLQLLRALKLARLQKKSKRSLSLKSGTSTFISQSVPHPFEARRTK